MAGRQFKEGLDFFPLDTTFFANDKVQLIEAEFGVKGVVVALRLLCKIYDKGYYYQWGGDECLLFSRTAGAEFVPSAVNEIVNGLVRRRFFDEGCFDRFGILTSQAIQEVYLQVCERRKQIDLIKEYILIDLDKIPINVHINSIDVDINGENEDKNRQRKGKESKRKVKGSTGGAGEISGGDAALSAHLVKNSIDGLKAEGLQAQPTDPEPHPPVAVAPPPQVPPNKKPMAERIAAVVQYFNDTCVELPKVSRLTDARKKAIKVRLEEPNGAKDLQVAIDKTAASRFLNGGSGRGWKADFDWIIAPKNYVKILEGVYDNDNYGTANSNPTTTQAIANRTASRSQIEGDKRESRQELRNLAVTVLSRTPCTKG